MKGWAHLHLWVGKEKARQLMLPKPKITTFTWLKHLWWKITGFCPNHGEYWQYPKHYSRNTAYIDDKLNYGYAPRCCQQEEYEHFEELWKDYYAGRL